MSGESNGPVDSLALAQQIDSICDRFEEALLRGAAGTLADWLPQDGTVRNAALLELARIELQQRTKAGERVRAESYFAQYPELAADPSQAIKLIAAEFHARRQREPGLTPDEYRARFPHLVGHPDWSSVFFGTTEAAQIEDPHVTRSAAPQDGSLAFLAPAQQPDEIGRLGPYRVLKVLGSGGMGVVFQAEDPQLQRLVALKVMRPELAATPSSRQRFLREARAVAAIEHDSIVPIYQVGEDRGVLFLAMQLLKGESLDERLRREGKLPPAEILRIGQEIARGLAAAHERGLVHRDIKPSNLWLHERPDRPGEAWRFQAKVLDFGLARSEAAEGHLTHLGHVLGTPAYMSPEQADGQAVDARSEYASILAPALSDARASGFGKSRLLGSLIP
jgi:hypothetical protein